MFRGAAVVSASLLLAAAPARSADILVFKSGGSIVVRSATLVGDEYRVVTASGEAVFRARDVERVESNEDQIDESNAAGLAQSEDRVDTKKPGEQEAGTALVAPPTSASIEDMLEEMSRKYALPVSLVRAVARRESALNPRALSPKGAQGVMQLMPGTAADLGVQDAFDAQQNIEAGVRLLRRLLEKYEGRVAEALAAYNAGEGAVARHRGVPPYRETRQYIRAIVRDFEKRESKFQAEQPKTVDARKKR